VTIGFQPPVELPEFFGVQLLADAGKRKAHVSVAAWASRDRKRGHTLHHEIHELFQSICFFDLWVMNGRPGSEASAALCTRRPTWSNIERANAVRLNCGCRDQGRSDDRRFLSHFKGKTTFGSWDNRIKSVCKKISRERLEHSDVISDRSLDD
jgi:hypothetical protein